MGFGVHSFAPGNGLAVQIFQIHKVAGRKEVLLHISHQPLYFALCLRRSHTANLRNNPISTAKSENCGFQITLPASRPATTVFMLSVRISPGAPPKYRNAFSIQRSMLRRSQRLTNSMYLTREYPRIITKTATLCNWSYWSRYWQIPQSIWAYLPLWVSHLRTAGAVFAGRCG